MTREIEELQKLIDQSHRICFFGGAGVSTESHIPDFRSVDGLYHQKYKYPPETILSHSFYQQHTEEFFDFYREKLLFPEAEPNDAHKKLAELEKAGKLLGIVTQNIDGLHQDAGSKRVMELHGSVRRNYCSRCHQFYSMEEIQKTTGIPYCQCGGVIKPDVVLYEEGLNQEVIEEAVAIIRGADLLIVGGTSLVVYPAAGLLEYFRGPHMVLINKSATHVDNQADLIIKEGIGKVLSQIKVS